jgi:hypothetical protein
MYFDKVDVTSEADRIKILDVVAGSNHLVMKPQMVGKNAGAPMIYITARNKHKSRWDVTPKLLRNWQKGGVRRQEKWKSNSQIFYPPSLDNAP